MEDMDKNSNVLSKINTPKIFVRNLVFREEHFTQYYSVIAQCIRGGFYAFCKTTNSGCINDIIKRNYWL